MALDRWIAVIFLMTSLVYGFAAYDYQLLPFERNMSFLPNTMPKVLSGAGIILALIIIFVPGIGHAVREDGDAEDATGFRWGQAGGLILAMILFAVALRPMGFLTSSVLFLVGSGWILGERKIHVMIPVALIGSGLLWYLVQELLGIFLRPLPWFLS